MTGADGPRASTNAITGGTVARINGLASIGLALYISLLVFDALEVRLFATIAAVAGAHSSAGQVSGADATTGAVDASTSDLHAISIAYLATAEPTITPSPALTLNAGTENCNGGSFCQRIYYGVGFGGASQTFKISGAFSFSSICYQGFSGGKQTSPLDQQVATANVSASTIQPGALTPSANGAVAVVGNSINGGTTVSIDGGFIHNEEVASSGGNHYGCTASYLIQTTAASSNPTITSDGGAVDMRANQAILLAAAGASGPPLGTLQLLGVGR